MENDQLEFAISLGYLPASFKDYRHTHIVAWDIEALETKGPIVEDSIVEALQNIVSVSVASNLPVSNVYFVRETSEPQASVALVKSFLDHLFKLEEIHTQLIPDEIDQAIIQLNSDVFTNKFSKTQCKLKKLLNYLKRYQILPCYAFNGSRYDIPCIIGLMVRYCEKNNCHFDTIKRGTGFMSLTIIKKFEE